MDHVSVEEYLAAEEQNEVRHEYLGGVVYAMSRATRRHNSVALNITIHRRAADWAGVKYAGEHAVAELRSVRLELPLARVYDSA
jgi:hypothetical protein